MPLEVLDLVWPGTGSQRLRDRPARLCLEGQPQRPPRSEGPRAQPRRAGAGVEADRRRHRGDRQRRSGGASRRRRQRRGHRRPRPGAFRADGRRPADRRADQCAVVRAASLRRPGRHLVAAVRQRSDRHVGPAGARRGHRRPPGGSGHSRLAQDPERAARKRGHRHGAHQCCEPGTLLGSAADFLAKSPG